MSLSPHEAAKILTEHNRWRRGQAPYDAEMPAPNPHTEKAIGEAIDSLVEFVRIRESATGHKARNNLKQP